MDVQRKSPALIFRRAAAQKLAGAIGSKAPSQSTRRNPQIGFCKTKFATMRRPHRKTPEPPLLRSASHESLGADPKRLFSSASDFGTGRNTPGVISCLTVESDLIQY